MNGQSAWGLSDTDQFPLFMYGYSANMIVTAGQMHGDNFSATGGVAPPTPHDLAVTKITAPKRIELVDRGPGVTPVTKRVTVQIQNRSPHPETISTLTGLVSLVAESLIPVTEPFGVGCANPTVVLHPGPPNRTEAFTLPTKRKLNVFFDVTYTCAVDPLKGAGHEDFFYTATAHHEVIDGLADSHAADDVCPRSVMAPSETDQYPDGKIKDKGCGGPKTDHTFGADLKTDVVVKQTN